MRFFKHAVAVAAGFLILGAVSSTAEELIPLAGIDELTGDGPWLVHAYYRNLAQVGQVWDWADIWETHENQQYLLAEVTRDEAQTFLDEGFQLSLQVGEKIESSSAQNVFKESEATVAATATASSNQAGCTSWSGFSNSRGSFPCYRTVEETYSCASQLAADRPTLAEYFKIGDSWEKTQNAANGYDINILKLTNSAVTPPDGADKPKLFMNCALHAREYTTAELCTRFAEKLVNGHGTDPDITWILDHQEVHLMLHTNPDGRKRAETGLSWRKNTNNQYCSGSNSRGADLNRNFEFGWGCCGGSSGNECDATFRGSSAASEPEIQTLQAYVRAIFPDQRDDDVNAAAPDNATGIALDIHSYSELVLWPWGFTSDEAPNGLQLQTLGRKLAYYNGYEPKQSIGLYPTDGTSTSFYYGELGVAAFTFELGTSFFNTCTFFETDILNQNINSLLYAAKVSRAPYMLPAGPEAYGASIVSGNQLAIAGDAVTIQATVHDGRYNARNGVEPSQIIVSANAFIDLPPWDAASVPMPMTAVDGSFDSTSEVVEIVVNTTGMAAGRHTVFIQGKDDDENDGSVTAVFLEVEIGCVSNAECEDGIWCNGNELCVSGRCTDSSAVCDDGVDCTVDVCFEGNHTCGANVPDHAFCDNSIFCDGAETCDKDLGCVIPNADPCTGGLTCDEELKVCTNCNYDGVCSGSEDYLNCPEDCIFGARCGDGICQVANGEDCNSCAEDCRSRTNGPFTGRYCCGTGGSCDGSGSGECSTNGFSCTTTSITDGKCGDSICTTPLESSCNCEQDCGGPPASETGYCNDGLDNDCDGLVDYLDSQDCAAPACNVYNTKGDCQDGGCRWKQNTNSCLDP